MMVYYRICVNTPIKKGILSFVNERHSCFVLSMVHAVEHFFYKVDELGSEAFREHLGHFAREWVAIFGRAERDLNIKGKNFFLFFSFLREQNSLVFMIKERERSIERGSLAQGTAVRWCKFFESATIPTQQTVNSFYEPSGASKREKKSVPCGTDEKIGSLRSQEVRGPI